MEGRRATSSPAVGSLLRAFLLLQALLFSNGQAQPAVAKPAVAKPVVAKPAGAAYTGDISDYRKGLFSRLEDAAGATEEAKYNYAPTIERAEVLREEQNAVMARVMKQLERNAHQRQMFQEKKEMENNERAEKKQLEIEAAAAAAAEAEEEAEKEKAEEEAAEAEAEEAEAEEAETAPTVALAEPELQEPEKKPTETKKKKKKKKKMV
jgi:hypothetical protein